MTKGVSYELHSNKGKGWVLNSIYDDKELAAMAAQVLLDQSYQQRVRIVQVTFESGSDKPRATAIFESGRGNAVHNVREEIHKRETPGKPSAKQREKKEPTPPPKNPMAKGLIMLGIILVGAIVAWKFFQDYINSL